MTNEPILTKGPPYLTKATNRRPEFRVHEELSHAKVTMSQQYYYDFDSPNGSRRLTYGGAIYAWSSEHCVWYLIYDIPHGTALDELPWKAGIPPREYGDNT